MVEEVERSSSMIQNIYSKIGHKKYTAGGASPNVAPSHITGLSAKPIPHAPPTTLFVRLHRAEEIEQNNRKRFCQQHRKKSEEENTLCTGCLSTKLLLAHVCTASTDGCSSPVAHRYNSIALNPPAFRNTTHATQHTQSGAVPASTPGRPHFAPKHCQNCL